MGSYLHRLSDVVCKNILNGKIARCKPNVQKNTHKRLNFAKQHLHKGPGFWNLIVWGDESKFHAFRNYGRPYVRRLPLTELNHRYTKKTVKHGAQLLWYGDVLRHPELVHFSKLKEKWLELTGNGDFFDDLPLTYILQQENDPKYCSRVVKDCIAANNVKNLEWRTQSPDLNPIENLWGIIKRPAAARKPVNKASLWEIIKDEWYAITSAQCSALVSSTI